MDIKQLAIFACLNGVGSATLLFEVEQSVVEEAIANLEWGNILLKLMKEIGIQKLAQISKVSEQVLEATVKIQQFRSSNNQLFQFDLNKLSTEKQKILEIPEKPIILKNNKGLEPAFDTETESQVSHQEVQTKGKKEKGKKEDKSSNAYAKKKEFVKQKQFESELSLDYKEVKLGSDFQDSPSKVNELEKNLKKKLKEQGTSELSSLEDLMEQFEKAKKINEGIVSNTQDYFCTNNKENPVYCIRCLNEVQNIKNKKSQHARECGKGQLKYPTKCFVCDISLHPATVGFHIYKHHPK